MIKLGNNTFEVPPPTAMRSFALQQKLLPIVGRVANVFLQLLGLELDVTKLVMTDVMRVLPEALPYVGQIFSEMPDDELERLTRALLRDGKFGAGLAPPTAPLFSGGAAGDAFDLLMQGRTTETWQLLWYAIEVWYPDFFARAGGLFASVGVKKASPSEASTTSPPTGPATGS